MERRTRIVRLPAGPVRRVLQFAGPARVTLPVELSEQVLRLGEDKACSYEKAREEFGYEPRTLEKGVAAEASTLREIRMIR